jgi:hypothetical protein
MSVHCNAVLHEAKIEHQRSSPKRLAIKLMPEEAGETAIVRTAAGCEATTYIPPWGRLKENEKP